MSLGALQDLITITANILTLSAAIGLMLGVILQPRRERANWYFALFLAMLGLWAYASLMLRIPGLNLLGRTQGFYLYLTGLGLTPITFFFAVLAFCGIHTRLTRLFSVAALPVTGITLVLLWSGSLVAVNEANIPSGADFGVILSNFQILPAGYVALVLLVSYILIAFLYLRANPAQRSRPLELPALLLLVGYAGNFIEPLSRLPFDTLMATAAASLIGYTVISHQVFNPLSEMNEQLRLANRDLRRTVNALAAEKERAEKLNAELRATSAYKSEFLAKMSHELRTPLNSIVGYSELLLQGIYGPLNERQVDRLSKIHRNGRNLLALINDILDLSKIEAGRLELSPQYVSLQEEIEGLLGTIEPLAQEKGLELTGTVEEALPALYADPLRVRQILTNLLSNAIKFTRQGGVSLRACRVEVLDGRSPQVDLPAQGWLSDGQWVLITVTDTGIGIAAEDHARIFDEFSQVDNTSTREFGGTGLGLAITKRLVEMHGGRIWLRSAAGTGSTFFVALPVTSKEVPKPRPTASQPAPDGDSPCVLVIDDSQEAIDILSTYLREGGYRTAHATDGPTGIELARQLRPDVITTDILMPGMNGWEVIDRLKADPVTAAIPVMIVSIVDQQPMSIPVGVAAHVSKPVERQVLLETVERLCHSGALEHPILVVDDHAPDRELLSEMLRSASYPVETCGGGQEALEWLGQRQASLVLLDLIMPQVSGFDVLTHIEQTPALNSLPVVIVSAKELTPDEEAFLKGRIADIIKKQQLQRSDLLARIARALA